MDGDEVANADADGAVRILIATMNVARSSD